jgi:predicted NUDIX family NTP pyrophosphohydrolase
LIQFLKDYETDLKITHDGSKVYFSDLSGRAITTEFYESGEEMFTMASVELIKELGLTKAQDASMVIKDKKDSGKAIFAVTVGGGNLIYTIKIQAK